MYWLAPFFYTEAKFGLLEKMIKSDSYQSGWNFSEERSGIPPPLFDHKGNQEILEELKLEPVNEKVRRCKSNWLRCVTGINDKRMPKIKTKWTKTT